MRNITDIHFAADCSSVKFVFSDGTSVTKKSNTRLDLDHFGNCDPSLYINMGLAMAVLELTERVEALEQQLKKV